MMCVHVDEWVCAISHVWRAEENFLESVFNFFPGTLNGNSNEQACKASTLPTESHVASLGYYCIEETLAMAIASSPQESMVSTS